MRCNLSGQDSSLSSTFVSFRSAVSNPSVNLRFVNPANLHREEHAAGELLAMHGCGEIRPEVTASYPLEDFAAALARFADHDVQGKMVLTTGRDPQPGSSAAIA
jgi:NADPH:quinone reductase-like Zn-dependent oxidoreductase